MHAQRSTVDNCALGGRATVPAHHTNADSRRGYFRTTLTTVPAGLPHPTTRALLLDTGAWTVARILTVSRLKKSGGLNNPSCV